MLAEGSIVAEKYRLIEPIGEGGMGAVWRAQNVGLRREVAIKLLRREAPDEASIERFRREAHLSASIQHPNVIDVLDFGVANDGTPFLVMELLRGESLADRLHAAERPTTDDVVRWISEALEGLAVVHDAGIIHRDLKPANLFLAREGDRVVTKVLDFGLSRSTTQSDDGVPVVSLTKTHQFLGTPYYMSPEQVRSAKDLDVRSDLFSVGVILYEALAGVRPFDGPNATAIIASIVADDPRPLSELRPDLPRSIVAVVHHALARDPDERFGDARAMRRALLDASLASSSGDRATAPTDPRLAGSGDRARVRSASAPAPVLPQAIASPPPERSVRVLSALAVLGLLTVGAAIAYAMWPEDHVDAPTPPPVVSRSNRSAPTVEVAGRHHLVAGPAELATIALRWRELPARERHELLIVPDRDRFVMITDTGVPPDRAARVASLLGTTASAIDVATDHALTPALVETTVSLNLRDAPSTEAGLRRTLPRGTIVVALYGRIGAHVSAAGGTGTWSRVVATLHDEGWSAARFIEPYPGCVPSPDAFLRDAPSDRAPMAQSDLTWSRTRVRRVGRAVEAFLGVARDRDRDRSYVGVYASGPDCTLAREAFYSVAGFVEDVLQIETEQAGGETLILAGWHPGTEMPYAGEETWSLYTIAQPDPVWEARLPTSQRLPAARRAILDAGVTRGPLGEPGFWPLVIRYPDRRREHWTWTGTTLARAVSQ